MGEISQYWKHFQKYVKRTEKKKAKSIELNSESLKGFFLILHYFCLLKYNIYNNYIGLFPEQRQH